MSNPRFSTTSAAGKQAVVMTRPDSRKMYIRKAYWATYKGGARWVYFWTPYIDDARLYRAKTASRHVDRLTDRLTQY